MAGCPWCRPAPRQDRQSAIHCTSWLREQSSSQRVTSTLPDRGPVAEQDGAGAEGPGATPTPAPNRPRPPPRPATRRKQQPAKPTPDGHRHHVTRGELAEHKCQTSHGESADPSRRSGTEVCPLPTRIVLSYLTDLARRITTQSGWGMITHRAPAGDSKRGLVPPGDTRPAIVTYRKAGCAPPRRPGQRPDALPPGDNSQQPERMPCYAT